MERTFSDTATTMSALHLVNCDFSIYNFGNTIWTCCFNCAFFAAFAEFTVYFRNTLTDNADIIQIGFYTVVWTSTYCNFEFVWQGNILKSFIKTSVDFIRKCIRVKQPVLTCRSLTGDNRTNFCTGATGH